MNAEHPIHPRLAPLALAARETAGTRNTESAQRLAGAMRDALRAKSSWLRPEHRVGDPTAYMRHLIYTDPADAFVITVITWLPGQKSPVHGHHVWCAFGVVEGTLTEEQFAASPAQAPTLLKTAVLQAGELAEQDFDGKAVHRVSNRGNETLVSLHLYGVASSRLTTGINRVYA